ncbi:GNAT family N-acetyltransferase [Mesorhizobium sp. WSM4976]|uniref:GNAT family N-acetyltransferase n=1 Tax=Mesorhizobium sp. WSM4976 TaxID=3038549 RepID=UPI00241756F2|nr:GNAT family N-acetyltransferase [Mesorhizobium sp. WSM4976]MDG4892772.1 GNAT family N-acetyltransferase [Mesorhizobium sp. WSM4976]
MAPVSRHPASVLAVVRRYEAAGFRAWPAAAVHYDGTWVVRLTAGHPAKRLNSVNPLDPGDTHAIEERIGRAARRFDAYGRPLTFRMSPLSGQVLSTHLDKAGWNRFDESMVMRLPLKDLELGAAMDQIPLKDISRFIGASLRTSGSDASLRPGLSEVIGAIQPEAGLFALEDGNEPLATLICVHDGDLAGLFEVATERSARKQGHGRNLILSALKWARLRGAREAWLQVEAGNAPALSLYRSFGFEEVYRYHYRRPPGA